jgi:hypothetical protein
MNFWLLIALSFVLILAGFLLPFLMALKVLDSGFTLSFAAYFFSLVGLVLGLYGAFDYSSSRKRDDR